MYVKGKSKTLIEDYAKVFEYICFQDNRQDWLRAHLRVIVCEYIVQMIKSTWGTSFAQIHKCTINE